MCYAGVGWGGVDHVESRVGHVGVGWVTQGWGVSCTSGVGHVGVGLCHVGVGWVGCVMQGWGGVGHAGMGWVMLGWGGLWRICKKIM